MKVLWYGARGPAVTMLQSKLQTLGFQPRDQKGIFGPYTKKAILSFQRNNKLRADGLAGPLTLAALDLAPPVKEAGPALRRVPKVFISYSHADVKWFKRLRVFLAELERQGIIDRWDDTRIRPGQNWRAEIKKALLAAAAAVLLVSQDFIASDFIAADELPALLDAAEKGKTVLLIVLISPSTWDKALSKYQTVNPPSKTLVEMDRAQREKVWLKVMESITAAMNR